MRSKVYTGINTLKPIYNSSISTISIKDIFSFVPSGKAILHIQNIHIRQMIDLKQNLKNVQNNSRAWNICSPLLRLNTNAVSNKSHRQLNIFVFYEPNQALTQKTWDPWDRTELVDPHKSWPPWDGSCGEWPQPLCQFPPGTPWSPHSALYCWFGGQRAKMVDWFHQLVSYPGDWCWFKKG